MAEEISEEEKRRRAWLESLPFIILGETPDGIRLKMPVVPDDAPPGSLAAQFDAGDVEGIAKFLASLEDVIPGGETNARESFKTYCTEARRRGLAVVISDFMDPS